VKEPGKITRLPCFSFTHFFSFPFGRLGDLALGRLPYGLKGQTMKEKTIGESRLDIPSRTKKLCSLIAIRDEKGKVVGRLDIRNKTVVFRGKFDLAARAFFQKTKVFIEGYIKESLTPTPTPEKVEEDNSKLGRAMRSVGLKKTDVLISRMREGELVVVTKCGRKFKF